MPQPAFTPQDFPAELRDRYEVLGELGRGGMGRVYKARDRDVQAPVAIKVLIEQGDEDHAKRFLRECQVLASLDHPGVVDVYEFGVSATGPYLVMSYLGGQSLADRPTLEDPVKFMLELADAIDALHGLDVLHRDLKPANVMVSRDGDPVLIDFGVAFDPERSRLTRAGGMMGTLAYMAPELFKAKPATFASEWYSWGVTVYEYFEGTQPYTVGDLFAGVQAGGLRRPPIDKIRAYPGLASAVLKALEALPEDRVDSAREIRELVESPNPELPTLREDSIGRLTEPGKCRSSDEVARRFYDAAIEKVEDGNFADAHKDLRRSLAYDPDEAATLAELGIVLSRLRRFEGALDTFTKLRGRDPHDFEALRFGGLCAERLEQREEAADWFQAFLLECPPEFEQARTEARSFLDACSVSPEQLRATFTSRLAGVAPAEATDPEIVVGGAAAKPAGPRYLDGEDWPSVLPRCHPPLAPGGQDTAEDLPYAEALAELRKDRSEAAEALLRKACLRTPHARGPHRELGILLANLGRFEEARVSLQRALELAGGDYEVRRFRALCLDRLNQPGAALADYREFLTDAPPALGVLRMAVEQRCQALEADVTLPPGYSQPSIASAPAAPSLPSSPPAVPGSQPPPVADGHQELPVGRKFMVPALVAAMVLLALGLAGGNSGPAPEPPEYGVSAAAMAKVRPLIGREVVPERPGETRVALERRQVEAVLGELLAVRSDAAAEALVELLLGGDGEDRKQLLAMLARRPSVTCVRSLVMFARARRDLPDSPEVAQALEALARHSAAEAPSLLVRLFVEAVGRRSESISAQAYFERVRAALVSGDSATLRPAIMEALSEAEGAEGAEARPELRKVLEEWKG